MFPVIAPLGDSALTITFGNTIDEQINQRVLSLFNYLKQQSIDGVKDIVPAYASLTVIYDIMKVKKAGERPAYKTMQQVIEQALQQHLQVAATSRTVQVPVCYHVSLGPDLISMSVEKSMSVEEIIRIHSSVRYQVYMIGFLPGFPYMGTVDEKIATPRKAVPSQSIAAGSVGIADVQTGIYPFNSPGGWNIIGQTPKSLFDPLSSDPCLFQPGDIVQFVPITLQDHNAMKQA